MKAFERFVAGLEGFIGMVGFMLWGLLILAFYALPVYVVVHFIVKYW